MTHSCTSNGRKTISLISENDYKAIQDALEANPADIVTRLNYLEEELIDALMYCEWIKEKLGGKADG